MDAQQTPAAARDAERSALDALIALAEREQTCLLARQEAEMEALAARQAALAAQLVAMDRQRSGSPALGSPTGELGERLVRLAGLVRLNGAILGCELALKRRLVAGLSGEAPEACAYTPQGIQRRASAPTIVRQA